MITVIGAGAGDAGNLSLIAYSKIKESNNLILKTEKMPISAMLKSEGISYSTLDDIYDTAEDFDELNTLIKARLEEFESCTYVVYGSALDDTSVRALENKTIIPGISLTDTALAYLDKALDVRSYTSFEVISGFTPSPQVPSIVTCIDTEYIATDVKCALSEIYGDEFNVIFYIEDHSGNQSKQSIPLYELDMLEAYNHTACIYLERVELCDVYKYNFDHLIEITRTLCAPDGCPWDSVQTHESLRPFLIEEAYEVADTIDKDDPYRLFDELGDVLFQVAIHSEIGKKCGEFDISDVTDAICRKMIHRHSNIFDGTADAPNWEELKSAERGLKTNYEIFSDVPEALASLARCEKILYKAEKAGIDLPGIEQTITNLKGLLEGKITDKEAFSQEFLFNTVSLIRYLGIHPELALNTKIKKFIDLFNNQG